MIDASHEPFDENVAITQARGRTAPTPRASRVEAELGMLGGVEEDIKVEDGNACLTDPDEAKEFVDARPAAIQLACAIGTTHGAYKFKGKQALHFDAPAEDPGAAARLPARHARLLLACRKDEVDRINAAGGKMQGLDGRRPQRVSAGRQAGRDAR